MSLNFFVNNDLNIFIAPHKLSNNTNYQKNNTFEFKIIKINKKI